MRLSLFPVRPYFWFGYRYNLALFLATVTILKFTFAITVHPTVVAASLTGV